jgi:thioredoxin domain-containing protein 5
MSMQLLRNKLPTYIELDSDTFQEVMSAPHKPLVVLVAAPHAELHDVSDRVRAVAQQWKNSKAHGDVVFAWMDADKWTKWLKSMYGIKAESGPQVVVSNHSVSLSAFQSSSMELRCR